ncbi:MAG: hypothetical protein V7709_08900 [Halioglobus sp.]
MIKTIIHATGISLLLATTLIHPTVGSAQETESENTLYLEVSQGGDDFRTKELRKYFNHLGRDFEVFRIRSTTPTEAGKVYRLERESAGNFRYNALKVSHQVFYKQIAKSVNDNFVTLEDTVHNDESEVNGTELLQIIYRQAKSLSRKKSDLGDVDGRVTSTYAFDKQQMVIVPTTFNFVDGARNSEGTVLESHLGVNGFSKHYLLSLILGGEAQVAMAGKIYIKLVPKDDSKQLDMAHVFDDQGDVDLENYSFDVTITNESGTFKPLGEELQSFAQLVVDVFELPELNYYAHTAEGEEPIRGTVTPTE